MCGKRCLLLYLLCKDALLPKLSTLVTRQAVGSCLSFLPASLIASQAVTTVSRRQRHPRPRHG